MANRLANWILLICFVIVNEFAFGKGAIFTEEKVVKFVNKGMNLWHENKMGPFMDMMHPGIIYIPHTGKILRGIKETKKYFDLELELLERGAWDATYLTVKAWTELGSDSAIVYATYLESRPDASVQETIDIVFGIVKDPNTDSYKFKYASTNENLPVEK